MKLGGEHDNEFATGKKEPWTATVCKITLILFERIIMKVV